MNRPAANHCTCGHPEAVHGLGDTCHSAECGCERYVPWQPPPSPHPAAVPAAPAPGGGHGAAADDAARLAEITAALAKYDAARAEADLVSDALVSGRGGTLAVVRKLNRRANALQGRVDTLENVRALLALVGRMREENQRLTSKIRAACDEDGVTVDDAPSDLGALESLGWVRGYEDGQDSICQYLTERAGGGA